MLRQGHSKTMFTLWKNDSEDSVASSWERKEAKGRVRWKVTKPRANRDEETRKYAGNI